MILAKQILKKLTEVGITMTGMQRLQLFQVIIVAFGIGVILVQSISLIKELRQYKGYSIRSGKHNLYRVYQLMLKPLGLTVMFVAVYFGMKWLYLQTFDASKVVMYDVWPDMYFGMASFCICFPLDALLEQIVLKRKLKSEYLDYVFWDAEIKAKKDRPLRYDETKREQYPSARWVHYMRIFICVTLGAFFIASGVESMTFFRAICADQIYEARVDQADVILRYQDVLSIEQDPEVPNYYVVRGNAGQAIYMNDDEKLQYVAQQCGIQIPQTE